METRPDFFPVYVSGQYLTSEHLNETHDFLWQQEKATRYLVAGNGIVSGLQPGFTGNPVNNITVSAGAATTIDGYLIGSPKPLQFDKGVAIQMSFHKLLDGSAQAMEKTEFDKILDKQKAGIDGASEKVVDVIEILPVGMPADDLPDNSQNLNLFGITSADAQAAYAIFAWIGIVDKENNHCQQGDCNTKGTQRNLVTRYFLVLNSKLPVMNTAGTALPYCVVSRIRNLSKAVSATALNKMSFDTWAESYGQLLPYLTANPGNKQLSQIGAMLTPAEQQQLTLAITAFGTINQSVDATGCPQYYTLFAGDLAKAINELIEYYNGYIKQYPVLKPDRVGRCAVLGGFVQAGLDKWKYYFIPAPEQTEFTAAREKLKMLFLRVTALINNFIPDSLIQDKASKVGIIKAIPSLAPSNNKLAHRAIPYYYDLQNQGVNNTVLKYWDINTANSQGVFSYYDSIIASRSDAAGRLAGADWFNYDFFRIEGHVGLAKNDAIKAIQLLIDNLGLPIQLIDCNVTYKGPQKWIDWYNGFVLNVADWLKQLRKDYPDIADYNFGPFKKIQEGITQTSYRDVGEVTKMFNNFNSFHGVMYNAPQPVAPKLNKSGKKISAQGVNTPNIPGSAYTQYQTVVKTEYAKKLNDDYREAIQEQGSMQSNKLIVLTDLLDLEYMSGALRGGTFVLLHDGSKVIGDGCLPYYYRVNQVRVFNYAV